MAYSRTLELQQHSNYTRTTTGLSLSKFRNAGQTCVCANRVYVENNSLTSFLDVFLRRLNENPDQLPFDQPLISIAQKDRVEKMVNDALSAGARVVWSYDNDGDDDDDAESYVRPRVMVDVRSVVVP